MFEVVREADFMRAWRESTAVRALFGLRGAAERVFDQAENRHHQGRARRHTGVSQAADTAADPTLLRRSLERLSSARVELRETHCSVVFLTSTRAYKLKKPVVFDFADQRSGAARATACHRELELNETLAPGLGLAVRVVVAAPDGYVLSNAQDPGAVDHVVEMRRFDEASTMRALLERGALTPVLASAAGAAIGRFHRTAQVLDAPLDHRSQRPPAACPRRSGRQWPRACACGSCPRRCRRSQAAPERRSLRIRRP